MGRTNIVIDDELIAEAIELTGAASKREVVEIALRRLVEQDHIYAALRKARGRIAWEGDIDAWRRSRG